ncbi:acetyl-coenzyme A synthetase [Salmonella enterica subsp. enterica serovar Heidelberg]|nr:acetyl-coenzyme A synthetase [Salmonella enterica subsp. enterica serovar Heidelberg]
MSQTHKHAIPANIADRCLINPEQYETKYKQSINDPRYVLGRTGKNSRLDHAVPKSEKTPPLRQAMCRLNGTRTAR